MAKTRPSVLRLDLRHLLQASIGQCVRDFELIAKATDPDDWVRAVIGCQCDVRHGAAFDSRHVDVPATRQTGRTAEVALAGHLPDDHLWRPLMIIYAEFRGKHAAEPVTRLMIIYGHFVAASPPPARPSRSLHRGVSWLLPQLPRLAMPAPPAQRRVVITGLGVVSPLGNSPAALWDALVAGRSGVAPLVNLPPLDGRVAFGGECRQFTGEIDDFGELEKDLKKSIRKALKMMCRESMMAVAAAQQAIADARVRPTPADGSRRLGRRVRQRLHAEPAGRLARRRCGPVRRRRRRVRLSTSGAAPGSRT